MASLIFCQFVGHGGEGRQNSGFLEAAGQPVLEGIINLPGFKTCLLNFSRLPRISSGLSEGQRDDNVEVVRINPTEGTVELIGYPGVHRLVLSLSNTPPFGIALERARLASVLRLYGELKGRSVLHRRVDSMTLTLRSSAKTKAEAVEALENALKQSGLAVLPDGTKFVQLVPQAQAASVAPASPKGSSAANETNEMVLPTGCIDFRNSEAAQVVRIYAELVGRELENPDQLHTMAADVITFQSQTPLTKEEARYAMDTLLAWAGLEVIEVREKSLRVSRRSPPVLDSSKQPAIIGKLGKPVGTEMTIEGSFQAGKNSWLLVTKVNDVKLADPIMISTTNLDPFSRIPPNTLCRFQGEEVTYVVEGNTDPKTGWPMQQASPGRHFDFKVTKVFAPDGVRAREEK